MQNRNLMVVVWLCYSRSCVEINIEYGVDRCRVDVGSDCGFDVVAEKLK